MSIRLLVVAAALLAADSVHAAGLKSSWDDPRSNASLGMGQWITAEPPATRLEVGDVAPSFSYMGKDGEWRKSADLTSDQAILLIFGAREENLLEIEQSRQLFLDLGITPVVVLDRRVSSARSMANRLQLSASVVTDPKCAIADLFNTVDPLNHRHAQSFFVLDQNRTVKAIGHGALPSPIRMLVVAARGLGRPLPEAAWSYLTE